ncbi:unnamed protein product [Rotaria magnacalcarata]|uniref:Uncharacterized protein n=2 Tax=Rotaria magnacalcarata TaxID=392030 RepID=A0A815FYM6_9BILA|nr:unnamed protein product [Rotaria magnacalcarata]CAF1331751.1 unnamed protein product [Rotaria magnacalcarata]CAF1935281.1 unnamed protein product [Rotaria magnacalcarata]CAF2139728.1 unnamed protein product [Rotaria magnacalcarata]CAF2159599.1 unnamed protein product [Rotaria magnacalcarata]
MATKANPYPYELIGNESLSNKPESTIMDATINELADDENVYDYLDQLIAASPAESPSDLSSLYPLSRPTKPLPADRKRFKRPSWATVGKRESFINSKRPSWAHIG